MTAFKHMAIPASISPKDSAPLEAIARMVDADMTATNAVIMERMQSHIPLIPQVAEYLIAAGGKRIRPLLTLAAAQVCGGTKNATGSVTQGLAAAVEFIHTATLLHDDVVDESAQRRGQPSANLVFGNKSTVLVGDFLFGRAFELMVESDDLRILAILARAARIISEGEVLQMSLTGDMSITLEQYRAVIDAKTAALFAAACEAGALSAKADDATAGAMRAYGHHLGMAFQIIDDVMDYAPASVGMGKNAGDDFREGKFTLPVILALAEADDDEKTFWTRTMQDHNQQDGDLAHARQIMTRTGALERGRQMAQNHAEQARAALRTLGNPTPAPAASAIPGPTPAPTPGPTMLGALDELLDFVVTRNH